MPRTSTSNLRRPQAAQTVKPHQHAALTAPCRPLAATTRPPPQPPCAFLAPHQATTRCLPRSSQVHPATPPWRHWRPCLATASHTTTASLARIQASYCQPYHHGTADAPLQPAGVGEHHDNASKEVSGTRRRRRRLAGRSDVAFAGACHLQHNRNSSLEEAPPLPSTATPCRNNRNTARTASSSRICKGGTNCSHGKGEPEPNARPPEQPKPCSHLTDPPLAPPRDEQRPSPVLQQIRPKERRIRPPGRRIDTRTPNRRRDCRHRRAWRRSSSRRKPPLGEKPHRCLPCACTSLRRRVLAAARKWRLGGGVGGGGGWFRPCRPGWDDAGDGVGVVLQWLFFLVKLAG